MTVPVSPALPARALDGRTLVAGQFDPALAAAAQSSGVRLVINHRPDFEEPGQPTSADVEAAVRAVGIEYVHAPSAGFPGPDVVEATRTALAGVPEDGRVLMFCRSGMRSTAAWAMARRLDGVDADTLKAAAAEAGYDLSRLPL